MQRSSETTGASSEPSRGTPATPARHSATTAALIDLFTLHKVEPQWSSALTATTAMALPLLAFTLAGQLTLGLTASLGSFLVLHLPDRSRRERAVRLPVMMAGFMLAAVIGIVTGTSLLGGLAAMLAVAVVASLLGLGFAVGSPGSMFYVLITGAMGALTAPTSLQGAGLNAGVALGMLVVGMLTAYLVVLAPLIVPSVRHRDAAMYASRLPWKFAFTADVERIFWRLTIATVVAVSVSAVLDLHRVQWVLLAIIAILQKDSEVRLSTLRALHRVLGTAVALLLFYLIALWDPDGWPLVALIAVLMFLFRILQPRNLGLSLVAITPMALVIAAKGAGEPLIDIVAVRVEDTSLGAGIAVLVLLAVTATRRVSAGRSSKLHPWVGLRRRRTSRRV